MAFKMKTPFLVSYLSHYGVPSSITEDAKNIVEKIKNQKEEKEEEKIVKPKQKNKLTMCGNNFHMSKNKVNNKGLISRA